MVINSLINSEQGLIPIEVEVALLPGLPVIQFLGLPDQAVKESAFRIKSAIKKSGFQFPKHHQILVNLRPNDQKKSSSGLELAVLVGLLFQTDQIKTKQNLKRIYFYGQLGLEGEISIPLNLTQGFGEALNHINEQDRIICTGVSNKHHLETQSTQLGFKHFSFANVSELKVFDQKKLIQAELKNRNRPQAGLDLTYSKVEARLLSLVALGGHSLLLAGPAGSGKTTFAKSLNSFLPVPDHKTEIPNSSDWRPFVNPHSSTPPASLIGGGGGKIFAGQIHQAHEGVLLLDELLEFPSVVLESLRGPLEESRWKIFRQGQELTKPFSSWIVATSNLCPCGERTPKIVENLKCRFSLRKCRGYSERLSGPLLDRFQILHFTEKQRDRGVPGQEILANINRALDFAQKKGRIVRGNSSLSLDQLVQDLEKSLSLRMIPDYGSERRRLATLRVARSMADLDQSEKIKTSHIEQVIESTFLNFERFKHWI